MKNNWKKFRLENINLEIIDGDRGKNYPKNNELSEKGYCLFLNAKNIPNYKFDFSECQFISKEKDMLLNNGKLEYNDIVLTTRGTLGHFAYYNKNIVQQNVRINSGMVILRNRDVLLDTSYFLKFLNSCYFKNQIDNLRTGSAQPQIPIKDLKKIEISLPPLETQQKIAKVLSAFDDKIELNNKINENLEQQVQALYKNKFIDNKNDNRIKCKAQDFFDISIGKTPPRKEFECFSNNRDIVWVSISDMGNCGIYINDSSEYLTQDAIKKYNVKVVPDNTVILSFKLTVGRIAITNGKMTTNEAIAHFNTDNKIINEYLYCYLKRFNFQTMGSTSSIATAINSKIIKAMPFIIPEKKELLEFHNFAFPMFEKIKGNLLENKHLIQLRDTLLPKLMNGEIDVDKIKI